MMDGKSLDEVAAAIAQARGIHRDTIERRKAFLEFGERDAALLRELHRRLRDSSADFIEDFYRHLAGFEETRGLLSDPTVVERLKHSQTAYFDSLTAGDYEWEYVHNRLRVGVVHERVGLEPQWYIGAYNKYLSGLLPYVSRLMGPDERTVLDTIRALQKIVLFDMGLALETYIHADRMRLQEAEAMSARLGRILDRSSNEIYVFDAATLCFVQVNQGAAKNLGYSVEELSRLTPLDLKPEFTAERFATLIAPLRSGERDVIVFETIHRRKDGSTYPVEVRLQVFRTEQPAVFLAVIQDITERRHLEAQLRQSQRMEAIGRLAGGVAHDFNNLLTVITGRGELVRDHLGTDDPRRRDVELILETAERAASLTRQLLAFSRKQVLAPRVLDLNTVVIETEQMLRRLLGEDINLVTRLDPAGGRVEADPGQIAQVIMNLAVNARDAMPEGGTLTIETGHVDLDEAAVRNHGLDVRPGAHVLLAVSDTGVGMDAETRAHLFEPFFTTKEQSKGTGLGLSTIYGIIKQSGGHVWVYSEPGHGTTFKIYLPRVEAPVGLPSAKAAPSPPRGGTETIVVVEDEEHVRALVCQILDGRGYTVLDARNGHEALDLCARHQGPIHLMVTDVVMPLMSGRDLAERVVRTRPELKILYVSGYTDNVIAHHGVLKKGFALVQKPFTAETLARKVREVLDAAP
jgi:PAS domain S-box-containing protein